MVSVSTSYKPNFGISEPTTISPSLTSQTKSYPSSAFNLKVKQYYIRGGGDRAGSQFEMFGIYTNTLFPPSFYSYFITPSFIIFFPEGIFFYPLFALIFFSPSFLSGLLVTNYILYKVELNQKSFQKYNGGYTYTLRHILVPTIVKIYGSGKSRICKIDTLCRIPIPNAIRPEKSPDTQIDSTPRFDPFFCRIVAVVTVGKFA